MRNLLEQERSLDNPQVTKYSTPPLNSPGHIYTHSACKVSALCLTSFSAFSFGHEPQGRQEVQLSGGHVLTIQQGPAHSRCSANI